jgi:hypothetical protein
MGKEDCTININYFNILEESLLIINISAYMFNIIHITREAGLPNPPVQICYKLYNTLRTKNLSVFTYSLLRLSKNKYKIRDSLIVSSFLCVGQSFIII